MSVRELSTSENNEVTFVNRFTLRVAPDEFERAFARTTAFMRRQPGFLGHTLLRHVDHQDRYVNVARWRDVASFRRAVAHPDFPHHAAALRALCGSEPNLYTPRQVEPAGDQSATG